MGNPKLTKSVVDQLTAGEKEYVTWCGQLPGFGVRVRPTGRKSYIAQYDLNGLSRKVTLGRHGVLTTAQARERARVILAQAQLGIDEAEVRAKSRREMTIAELCDEYLLEGCAKKKPSTIATDRGRIERHVKPLLGTKKISGIASSDVERFLHAVAQGKTAADFRNANGNRVVVRGGKGTATRTVRLLGGIFSYAVRMGYLEKNPRSGVRLFPDNKGQRFLSDQEIQRLGATLNEAESTGLPWKIRDGVNRKHLTKDAFERREKISPFAVAAIRILLLTGCRVSEILNLRWSDVDLTKGVLKLPDSKTGAKEVMLGRAALAVLQELPRLSDNPHVIVGAKPGKPRSDLKGPWKRVCEHAELRDLRLHDLRHSFASVGVASGMSLPLVGELLGHADPSTTARYAHVADDARRRALDTIEQSIANDLGLHQGTSKAPARKLGPETYDKFFVVRAPTETRGRKRGSAGPANPAKDAAIKEGVTLVKSGMSRARAAKVTCQRYAISEDYMARLIAKAMGGPEK